MVDCEDVRERVSALRDGEEGDATPLGTHVRDCPPCRAWLDDLDRLTSRYRLGLVRSPDLTAAALAEWDRQSHAGASSADGWRWVLAAAGTASILVSATRLIAGLGPLVWGPAHAHHMREIAAVEVALGLGFLLVARRPSRFSAGLVPVCVALVALLATVVAVDILGGHTSWMSELVHVPLALGTVALGVVHRRSGRDPGPGSQRWGPGPAPDQELAA